MRFGNDQRLVGFAANRRIVFIGNGNRNRRIIYTDGRKQVGQIGGNDDNPLFYGQAVAKWEADTWVVDTRLFNEEFWFDNGGLPHTEQLHLVERFTRPNLGTLHYEATIDDPGAYTRPWKIKLTLYRRLEPNAELMDFR